MRNFAAALVFGAVAMILGGCGVTGQTGSITINVSDIDTITAGQSKQVQGSVQAGNTLTLSFAILDSIEDTLKDGTVSCTATGVSGKSTIDFQTDASLTIATTSAAISGRYYLQINACDGTDNYITDASFLVVGGGTQAGITTVTLTLGAQQSSSPSLLDANNMTAFYDSITNPSVQAKIDAIFMDSTTASPAVFILRSPSVATSSPYSSWSIKTSSQFKDVSSTANFSGITTQGQIDSLWGSGAGVTTLVLYVGQTIAILTNTGAYEIIQVSAINGTDPTATMTIIGKY